MTALGRATTGSHTGGCTFVKISATPGWRIPSVCYGHQYHSTGNVTQVRNHVGSLMPTAMATVGEYLLAVSPADS